MRSYLRIDLERIAANYRAIRDAVGESVAIAAVVKANAYGHGAAPVATRLYREGCRTFAVATLGEAVELRDAGIEGRVLLLSGFVPGEEQEIVARNVTPLLHSLELLCLWRNVAQQTGKRLRCHLKINTGMTRGGLDFRDPAAIAESIASSPEVDVEGIGTHLASAEDFDDPATGVQLERFQRILSALAPDCPRLVHVANSAAIAWRRETWFNMVRPGLALYGHLSRRLGGDDQPQSYEVEPAFEWNTKVLDVRDVAAGERIGYNGTYTAPAPMRVALLASGYADGLRRELSNNGNVLVRGRSCPIVGRISMDLTTVDVTQVPNAAVGDEATLLGPCVDLHEIAERCGTVSYEILAGISSRVVRLYGPENA